MIPEPGSWGFVFLIYLLLGWFATRGVEKSSGSQWSLLGFTVCWVLWLPLCLYGIATANRE